MEGILRPIYQAILDGDKDAIGTAIHACLDTGVNPGQILTEAMIPAMEEVGRQFEAGEFYVPEMLVSARAMQNGLSILKPLLREGEVKSAGKVVIGTIKGDLHDIGKNLVSIMLEGSGFEILDLGVDVSFERFVQTVRDEKPDILALSALLTTTMPGMKSTIDALDEAGLRGQVKVIVGGAPLTGMYAESIGADGFAPDAGGVVALARRLLISNNS
jgi:5-methyltetrahydrofolate--homocysteine methyltransferase